MKDVFKVHHISDREKRKLPAAERKRRKTGNWGDWEYLEFDRGSISKNGWAADFSRAHRNNVFCVLHRTLTNQVQHFAIASLSGIRPTWHEMQRIKNELASEDLTAIEIYPPEPEVVDEADMFHIWVLPTDLPFGLHNSKEGIGI